MVQSNADKLNLVLLKIGANTDHTVQSPDDMGLPLQYKQTMVDLEKQVSTDMVARQSLVS